MDSNDIDVVRRVKCTECGWKGTINEELEAPNPFDPGELIYGCPHCKSINTCVGVCMVKKCWEYTSCGTPTKIGYLHTCGKHKPKE